MKLINLTPHAVRVVNRSDSGREWITFPPSGKIARVDVARSHDGLLNVGEGDLVRLARTQAGQVTGLPDPLPGVGFIVSGMVAAATTGRDDVFSPDELERDEAGRVVGCLQLGRHAPSSPDPRTTAERIRALWAGSCDEHHGPPTVDELEEFVRGGPSPRMANTGGETMPSGAIPAVVPMRRTGWGVIHDIDGAVSRLVEAAVDAGYAEGARPDVATAPEQDRSIVKARERLDAARETLIQAIRAR